MRRLMGARSSTNISLIVLLAHVLVIAKVSPLSATDGIGHRNGFVLLRRPWYTEPWGTGVICILTRPSQTYP